MEEAGLPCLIDEVNVNEAGGYDSALRWLAGPVRPTAIICAMDRIAFGVMRAARQMGLSIPRDLSVIGHDNLPASADTDPPLSTMELPIAETGERLASMLLKRISGEDMSKLQDIRPVQFLDRGTMGPAPRD